MKLALSAAVMRRVLCKRTAVLCHLHHACFVCRWLLKSNQWAFHVESTMSGIDYKAVDKQTYEDQRPGTSGLRKKVRQAGAPVRWCAACRFVKTNLYFAHAVCLLLTGQGIPAEALLAKLAQSTFNALPVDELKSLCC